MATSQNAGGGAFFPYLFEAKGVQRWLFDSGPLRDLVGASDLVAGLAASDDDDLVRQVLEAAGAPSGASFSRRAGGAFVLHVADKTQRDRFRALWRLAVGLRCPGLECADVAVDEALPEVGGAKAAYRAGTGVRFNGAADLPPTGHPFTLFNPRTGRLATGLYDYDEGGTLVDVISAAHRRHAGELAEPFDASRARQHDRVARRFLSPTAQKAHPAYVFPRNLEADEGSTWRNPAFPFRGEDRRIAVVHADLSGLGQIFRAASDKATSAKEIKEVADAIENVVEGAAQDATQTLLRHAQLQGSGERALAVLPARPVLLGGDDITILVRADLAFGFAQTLLQRIEERSGAALAKFVSRIGVDRVSACAGLAIVKSGQPFLMANALAEGLVKRAKLDAKAYTAPYPSFLAFHVAQTTQSERYSEIVERELTARGGAPAQRPPTQRDRHGDGVKMTANPYRVGSPAVDEERSFDCLLALACALDAAPKGRGKLIEAGRHLFTDAAKAEEAWLRWREVLGHESPDDLKRVDAALEAVVAQSQISLTASAGAINDALELIDLGVVQAENAT